MKPITISSVKPKMTTFGSLVNEMKEYARGMEPYKKRFYKFISENPCDDIQMVPRYNIDADAIYDYNGHFIKTLPLKSNAYNLDFPAFPHVLNQPSDVLGNIEGAVYQAEIRDYDDVDYRSFVIPDAYVENPDAWETEVLKRIEIRERLADTAIKALFPNAPKEVKVSSNYTINDHDPWAEKKMTTDRLIVQVNHDLLPQKGEPDYREVDSIVVELETGNIVLLDEILPNVVPFFKGIEEVGF